MARILLIDDETNIRMMIGLALRHVGHTVGTASDGVEGLAAFGDGSEWDLTLLDQRLPGMQGLEVLREIRLRQPTAVVIMITAFGTIDLAGEAIRAGATDFLRKPFTAEMLRDAVQGALNARKATDEGTQDGAGGADYPGTAINGFHIYSSPHETPESIEESPPSHFSVVTPRGETQKCAVVLTREAVAEVKNTVGGARTPLQAQLWHALCEEALANYLWQNAELPPNGLLRVEELTSGLRRRLRSMTEQPDQSGLAEIKKG